MTDITTPDGYMQRFWELVSEKNKTSRSPMRDALKSLEDELQEQYGIRRYTSYSSFAAARNKLFRKPVLKTV